MLNFWHELFFLQRGLGYIICFDKLVCNKIRFVQWNIACAFYWKGEYTAVMQSRLQVSEWSLIDILNTLKLALWQDTMENYDKANMNLHHTVVVHKFKHLEPMI